MSNTIGYAKVELNAEMLQNWLDKGVGSGNEGQKVQFLSEEMQARIYNPAGIGGRAKPSQPAGNVVMKIDANDKEANKGARASFLSFVLKECGVRKKEELPEVVQTAMKLNSRWLHQRHDFDKGSTRPLTVRRIKAVMTSIYAHRAGIGEWNGDSQKCKDFWNGLSPELKDALRQKKNAGLFKDLFQCYSELNAAERKTFLSVVSFVARNNVEDLKNHMKELKDLKNHMKELEDFLNGLSPELKDALRQSKNLEMFKKLFEHYKNAEETGTDPAEFTQMINRVYSFGLKKGLSNPIPLGCFNSKGTGSDPIGSCIKKQLSSTTIHTKAENEKVNFKNVLGPFNREVGSLTIKYKSQGHEKSIVLTGGGDGPMKVIYGGKEFSLVERGVFMNPKTGKMPYSLLERILRENTGLKGKKLYALLIKASSSGFTSLVDKKDLDYQNAFMKTNGLPAGTYAGRPRYEGTITVMPKQKGSQERKFQFELHVDGNITSVQTAENQEDGDPNVMYQEGGYSVVYDGKDPGNKQSLTCKCTYTVPDGAEEKFNVSDLTYDMTMSMQRMTDIAEG